MAARVHQILRGLLIAGAVVSALGSPAVQAQTSSALTAKRIALVIGNSAYKNIGALTNPNNDATDIAAKLTTLKFEVLLATDATHARMTAILAAFKAKVTREHVALVFYAGHGVQVNRESFLLPVDMPDAVEADDNGELRADAANHAMISMASVLAPLETARLGIVFLDACRNSARDVGLGMSVRTAAIGKPTRSVPVMRGVGSMEVKPSDYSAGVFRAYATQLNNVAYDGGGRNSPFTKALLHHISTRGIIIQELMIRVRKEVMKETNNQQVPWEEAALNESFAFVPDASTSTRVVPRQPAGGGGGGPAARQPGPTKAPSTGVGTGF